MATDLVTNALTNLYSLYQEERELMQFADQEKKKLASNLTAIESVLQDAEEKQLRGTSRGLDDWLQKLEDVVFMLDDILDECSTEAIRDKYESDRSCSFLSFLHPHKVIFRHNISTRMKAITEQLELIDQEKNRFSFATFVGDAETERQASASVHPNIPRARQTSSAMTEDCVYGREKDKETLVCHLLEGGSHAENLTVHTIVGMGGLGKTTLAQLVYNDKRVQDYFQLKIWICVSENFELDTLIKSIIGSPHSHDREETKATKLRDMLQGKRYLLVLDDIWNDDQEKWNQFKCLLSCGSKGSSILVTTRQEKIATIMRTPPIKPYHLTALSDEDCWLVFKKRAFGLSVAEETENLVMIGTEIVAKCRGVPLAAKALGGLLSFKKDERSWLHVKNSELWNLSNAEDSIFGALRLSYLDLPLRFRRCFSYFATFPKDYWIKKEHIIHLWMANGLIPCQGMVSTTSEIEDIGEEIVSELQWRSLIEDVRMNEFGDIVCFKMHDLVHDLARCIMRDESYVADGTRSKGLQPRTRYMSINSEIEPGTTLELVKNEKGLRTFMSLSSIKFSTLLISSLSEHASLRALDLTRTRGLRNLPFEICVLKHLRYLNLSFTSIQQLPESTCSLWNLQVLNLDFCDNLKILPQSIGRLGSLRHLYIKHCFNLSCMPPSIGGLTSLRTLNAVIVGEGGVKKFGFELSALGRLKYVKGEMEIQHLERVREVKHAEEANLVDKCDLDQLTLRWIRSDDNDVDPVHEMQVLEALRPSSKLKYLKVTGYKSATFSQWMTNGISNFRYLQSLCLDSCKNCAQIPALWRLPSLKRLELDRLYSLRFLIEAERDSDGQVMSVSFPSLETLTLKCLYSLEGMLMPKDEQVQQETNKNNMVIFPRLFRLQINDCRRLSASALVLFPSLSCLEIDDIRVLRVSNPNIEILNSLEELIIKSCSDVCLFNMPMSQVFQGLISVRTLCISQCGVLTFFPEGLEYLSSLEELQISWCDQLVGISNVVHHLPSLRELRILSSGIASLDHSSTQKFGHYIHHLSMLQRLQVDGCPNLLWLPDWLGDAIYLEEIYISGCPKLMSIPECIRRLANLKRLEISGCPDLSRRCRREVGPDWEKIAHIPNILLDDDVVQ